jgi:hypothetical protein
LIEDTMIDATNPTQTARALLEDAQVALLDAEQAHRREEQRLADATAELERLDAEVGAANPDDEKAFGRAVAARDAARARRAALAEREERA